MSTSRARRNVFISHHHKDDEHVDKLTRLLKRSSYEIRNSSIRAKPANQRRIDRGDVKPETIKRLLRMKMSWAGSVVVLIGKETHAREWVNWEIEQANRLGKRIVGVFTHGATKQDIPPALEKYGSALVGWNTDRIIAAIEGDESHFENPDGTPRVAVNPAVTSNC